MTLIRLGRRISATTYAAGGDTLATSTCKGAFSTRVIIALLPNKKKRTPEIYSLYTHGTTARGEASPPFHPSRSH